MSDNFYDQVIASQVLFNIRQLGNSKGPIKTVTDEQLYYVNTMRNKEDIFNTPFFDKQRKVAEMEIKKLSSKNEANNADPCPRCGGARYNIDKQTRSSDEARSFYIKCGTCGLTQSE